MENVCRTHLSPILCAGTLSEQTVRARHGSLSSYGPSTGRQHRGQRGNARQICLMGHPDHFICPHRLAGPSDPVPSSVFASHVSGASASEEESMHLGVATIRPTFHVRERRACSVLRCMLTLRIFRERYSADRLGLGARIVSCRGICDCSRIARRRGHAWCPT